MIKKTLLSIFVYSVLLNGISHNKIIAEESNAVGIIQPARHISHEGGYSIEFPATWEIMKGVMGTDVIALAPAADPQDMFKKNGNIIFANLDKSITPEEFYSLNLKSLGKLLVDFDLEESKDVTVGGASARELVFTHTMGMVDVKVVQYLLLHGNKAYVITFTANQADFNKYRKTFEETAATFRFEKN